MTILRRIGEREAVLALACMLAVALFGALAPVFLTVGNLTAVLRNATELLLVGLGMTLLLGVGAIDVSVGAALGLAAIAVGRLLQAGAPPLVAALGGTTAGAAIGLFTGAVVVGGRIPAIVATLGLYGVYRAAIFLALGGSWLTGLPTTLTQAVSTTLAGVPLAALVILAAYLAVALSVRLTPFGPHLLASGHAPVRARLAGVPVRRTQLAAFALSGLLCGVAATLYVATYRNVAMTIGGTLALEAVAAVVLGGTSILGGRISLVGTILGVALLRILQNGLLLAGVSSLWQPVVTGALLVAVLGAEALRGRFAPQRAAHA